MHIVPNNAHIEAWQGGSLITVRRGPIAPKIERPNRGLRRPVTRFTYASRRRLLRTIAKLRKDELPWFVTLTYPGCFDDNPESWKADLKNWSGRLKRSHPDAAFVWRLEFQTRGAPHFHLLVYGINEPIKTFQAWISASWYEVVSSEDVKHLAAGTSVQNLRSPKAAMRYASKELSKTSQAVINNRANKEVGRWWGAYFRANLPWAECSRQEITDKGAVQLIRLMRRYARLPSRAYRSLAIFCDAESWVANLSRLTDP